ncbi:DUF1190 domain-containing protein [Xenorhabdus sp. M]|uniref:DUF1190 domain-containing protein n=1 Tax=Xenorhabdus szentirmaii TaxID=290112 RepID=A0AAW3YSX4_9GAMM|nr:DUF1190 domain-containing protein [Xenorhabdus sp. M]MBD2801015.1 DUF1190 domain-containing protein [Xenorhabdus sp. M]
MSKKKQSVKHAGEKTEKVHIATTTTQNFQCYSKEPFRKKTKSRKPSILTLVIMGGAAVIVVKSCSSDEKTSSTKEQKTEIFRNMKECTAAGYRVTDCYSQQQAAIDELSRTAKSYHTLNVCELDYGRNNCYHNISNGVYSPVLAGFTMEKRPNPPNEEQSTYSGGGGAGGGGAVGHSGTYHSTAFHYTAHDRNALKSPGNDKKWYRSHGSKFTNTPKTVSRGGFGGSSRGSWGG